MRGGAAGRVGGARCFSGCRRGGTRCPSVMVARARAGGRACGCAGLSAAVGLWTALYWNCAVGERLMETIAELLSLTTSGMGGGRRSSVSAFGALFPLFPPTLLHVPFLLSPPVTLIFPFYSPPSPGSQKIQVNTLDNILAAATAGLPPSQRLPRPPSGTLSARTYSIDLLKIDVEGWDVSAMAASPATLSASRLVLWECHALMQAAEGGPGTTHDAAAAMLAGLGFESYKLGRGSTLLRFDGDWGNAMLDEPKYMGWHNCLAIRRDEPLRVPLLRSLSKNIQECLVPWGLREAAGGAKR